MRTSDGDILAIGEASSPLYEMARVAAARLCGDETISFVHNDTPTKL
jgi:nitrite reductase (NADH) large subunit